MSNLSNENWGPINNINNSSLLKHCMWIKAKLITLQFKSFYFNLNLILFANRIFSIMVTYVCILTHNSVNNFVSFFSNTCIIKWILHCLNIINEQYGYQNIYSINCSLITKKKIVWLSLSFHSRNLNYIKCRLMAKWRTTLTTGKQHKTCNPSCIHTRYVRK